MAIIVYTIRYDTETRALNIDGPIQDRILCYGMLGMAMDIVHEFNIDEGRKAQDTPGSGLVIPQPGFQLPKKPS